MAKTRSERINELYENSSKKKDDSRKSRINNLYESQKASVPERASKPLVQPKDDEEEQRKERENRGKLGSFFTGTGKQLGGGYMSAGGTILQNDKARDTLNRITTSTGDPMQDAAKNLSSMIVNRIKGDDYAKVREEEKKAVDNTLETMGRKATTQADRLVQSGAKDIEYVKEDMGAVGKFAVDVGSQSLMMFSDALLSRVAPGLGQAAFAARAGGFGASEARQDGASEDQQLIYGAASGLMELGIEKLFSAGKYLKGMYGKGAVDIATPLASKMATSNLIKGITKTPKGQELVYQLTKLGVGATEEGIEEALADLISPLLQRAVYADEIDMPTFKEVAYDFLLGAASGGVFSTPGLVSDFRSGEDTLDKVLSEKQETGRDVAQEMIDRASVQGESSEAQQFAKQLAAQRESGKEVLGGQLNDLQRMTRSEQLKHEKDLQQRKVQQDNERLAGDVQRFAKTGSETERRAIVEISSGFVKDELAEIEKIVAEKPEFYVTMSADSATSEAVAKAVVGTATSEDIDRILMKPEAKALVGELTNHKLPTSNDAARKELEDMVSILGSANRVDIQRQAKAKIAEDMGASLGQQGSRTFVQLYQNVADVDNEKFNVVFNRFYDAGAYSIPLDAMSRLVDDMGTDFQQVVDRYFTPEVRMAIHKAGAADSRVETVRNEERVVRREKAAETAKKGSFRDESSGNKMSAQTKTALESFAKRTGVNIVYVDTLSSGKANGKYGTQSNGAYINGTIYLAADADNPLLTVAKHELTHHLKQFAPKEYQELEDFVFSEWYGKDQSAHDAAIDEVINRYKEAGHPLTRAQAREEILADAAEAFFRDDAAIDKAIAHSKSLGEAILDGIRAVLDTFSAIREHDSNKQDRGYGNFMEEIGILEEAERKWMKALEASMKNDVKAGMQNKSTSKSLKSFNFTKTMALENMKTVAGMEAVSKVGLMEFRQPNRKPVGLITEFFERIGSVENEMMGTIALSHRGVKESWGHKGNYGKIGAFRAVPDVIEKGKVIDAQRDWKGRGYDTAVIAAPVEIEGTPHYVGVVVKRVLTNNLQRYYLHDVMAVKKEHFAPAQAVERTPDSENAPIYNLLHQLQNVNSLTEKDMVTHEGKFSLKELDDEYMSAVKSGDMSKAQRMVDAAAKKAGYVVNGFHGTTNLFHVFDTTKSNIENNWGRGIYATTSEEDAKVNYASEDGADLTNRIERLAEMMESWDEYEDMDYDQRVEAARNQLSQGESEMLHVALRMENPVIVERGYSGELFTYETEYDEEADEYSEPSGTLIEVIEHMKDIINDEYDWASWDAEHLDQLYVEAIDYGGLSAIQLQDSVSDILADVPDAFGNMAASEILRAALERMGYDGIVDNTVAYKFGALSGRRYGGMQGVVEGTTHFIAFNSSQVKLTDAITYDDSGNIIPLSERFNTANPDIRYSIKDDVTITESGTVTKQSLKSWTETDKGKLMKALKNAGYAESDIEKWMDDVNSVAAIIAADRKRLDYTPDEHQQMLRNNDEYYKTLDASTLCKKRLLYQGTYNAIQHRLPNTSLTPDDVIHIRYLMDEMGYEVPCGICYEESRKKHEGTFAKRWLDEYKGDYTPTLDEVTTTDGRAKLRREHPEVLESYLAYQRTRGSANPKVSMTRTDYRNDILKLTKRTIDNIKHIGGLRIQSFSDFEVPHTIDMMQAIMDMSVKGLTSQAYTKVPAFARIFGGTGVKINLSLIGKADEAGRLVFDDKEGMPHAEAFAIREMYPDDVGTIIVGANEASILAAWADDRIDMVIPFHRSGWSFDELERLGLEGYEDFTEYQSEKYLDPEKGAISFKAYKDTYGEVMESLYSDDYWDFNKTGKENAEAYLRLCAEHRRRPVFCNFLVDNGDGSWTLQPDGSTDGYWKSLIDFKMYNNDGLGAPQKLVQPNFNMEEARKVLEEYDEESDNLPIADDIVEQFVSEYKATNPNSKYQLKEGPSTDRKVKTLEDRVAHLKSEMKRTDLKTPVEKDTKIQASRLLKRYDSNLVLQTKLVDTMKDIFRIYKSDGDWKQAYEMAEDMAHQIVDKIAILHDESWQEYKDLRKHLKTVPVAVSEADKASMTDYESFRKANFGRIKLTNGQGLSVDQYYQSLMENWPDKFTDDYTNAADQLYHIADVLDSLAPWYEEYNSDQMYELVMEIAEDIMVTTEKLATRKTFADRKAEEKTAAVERVKRQRDEAMERLKDRYEEKLILQKKVSRERMDAYKEKQKDRASRKKAMDRLQKSYNWLKERLKTPSDTKHIHEEYQAVIAQILEWFDFETERTDAYEAKNGPSKRIIELRKFKDDLEVFMKRKDVNVPELDPDFMDDVTELCKTVDGKRLAELDTVTLDRVSRMLKQIQHQMSYVDRCFNDDIKEAIHDLGESTIWEANEVKGTNEYTGIRMRVDNLIHKLNVTPADMFELVGGAQKTLYQAMRKGFDRHIQNVQRAIDFTQSTVDKKQAKKWSKETHTFTLESGKVEMTTSQLMSLYALMQREQAQTHIFGSGITMAPVEIKDKLVLKRKIRESKVMPALEEVLNMIGTLTDEQKQVADHMRRFLSEDCAEWGNRTSMKLYGYKKFTEKDYFPIKSTDTYLNEDFSGDHGDSTLRNMGFTKNIVTGANNPIVIDDFFTVFTDHVNKMSMYEALVPAMTDFQRVWNYKQRADGKQVDSVQDAIRRAYGKKTLGYINNFLRDINGSQKSRNSAEIATALIASYKKASIGGNLRVLLQQPTAIVRAWAVMSPKYFVTAPASKTDIMEMQEHCPIAQWKSYGFYNTDVARDMKKIMLGETNISDFIFMSGYGKADDFTWGCIWKAVKKEVEAKNPNLKKGSDEYWQKVNERASYVFDRTQVVDSVFHRSEIMRDKGTFEKIVTSFMAEPTKTFNLLRTELYTAKRELDAGKKMDATKRVSRVLSTYLLNAMTVSMAAAIADAMRGTGGDDDEDKGNFRQRWWAHSIANFKDNANPLNMIPLVKDVVSARAGYDVIRLDAQGISNLMSSVDMWEDILIAKDSKYTKAQAMRKSAEAISYITGHPVKNILRDAEAVTKVVAEGVGNLTAVEFELAKWTYTLGAKSDNRYIFADLYYDALAEGDKPLAAEIKRYMQSQGVTYDYINGRKKTWQKNREEEK